MLRPPYDWLFVGILGIIVFFMGVASIYGGKSSTRFHGPIYRAEKPKWFWWNVVLQFLSGLGAIGYSLYKIYTFPN
jgi:hypothetical protein